MSVSTAPGSGRDAAPRSECAPSSPPSPHPDLPDRTEPQPVGKALDDAFRRKYRLPGRVQVAVTLDGDRYFLRPDAAAGLKTRAAFLLVPFGPGAAGRSPIGVAELVDSEEGCDEPGFLGLSCSCEAFTRDGACRHVRALVAAGILRPAPARDEPGSESQDLTVGSLSEREERTW